MDPREELQALRRMAELEAKAAGAPAAPAPAAPEPTWGDRGREALQGAVAGFDKAALGIKGLLPQVVQDLGDRADAALGMRKLTPETAVQAPDTWAGTAGNILGETAIYAPLAVASGGGLPAQLAAGAASSAALTPGGMEDRAKAAGMGAAGAGAGHVLAKTMGRLFKPIGDKAADTVALEARGVEPTFGQGMAAKGTAIGRGVGRVEEGAMSVPIASGPLRQSRERAMDQWRQATRNEALPPGAASARNVDDVRQAFNDSYTRTLDSVPLPYASVQYVPDMRVLSQGMPVTQAQRDMVEQVFNDIRLKHMQNPTPGAQATAAGAHGAESDLKALARRYGASQDPAQQELGRLFGNVADEYGHAWRNALPTTTRSEIDAIDQAYRSFVPLRQAAKTVGAAASDAVPSNYTPAVLTRAVRTSDKTPNKTQYTGRRAPQQELARLGQGLQGKVPDSGTTERALTGLGIGGGAAALGALPQALAGGAALAAYGTRPVQNYLMGRAAPAEQEAILRWFREMAPYMAAAGASQSN